MVQLYYELTLRTVNTPTPNPSLVSDSMHTSEFLRVPTRRVGTRTNRLE